MDQLELLETRLKEVLELFPVDGSANIEDVKASYREILLSNNLDIEKTVQQILSSPVTNSSKTNNEKPSSDSSEQSQSKVIKSVTTYDPMDIEDNEDEQLKIAIKLSLAEPNVLRKSGSGIIVNPQNNNNNNIPSPDTRNAKRKRDDMTFIPKSEEEEILFESSIISNQVFLPWNEDDIWKEEWNFKEPFVDPDGLLSLTKEQTKRLESWKRPSSFIKDPKMCLDTVSARCIKQSLIGDCSFLCAMSVAANYEQKYKENLLTQSIYPKDPFTLKCLYNPSGKYAFKLYWNGSFRKIIIDDFLPCNAQHQPLCSVSNNRSEIWVSMLEKAYMKVLGGYSHGSSPSADMQILFGWIPEAVLFQTDSGSFFDKDIEWSKLDKGFNSGECLVILTTPNPSTEGEIINEINQQTGLLSAHAYACLDVRCVEGHCLLQLRNPWQSHRWKGKFSEYDIESWTPKLQQLLDYDLNAKHYYDDGIFWIDWDSVVQNFYSIHYAWNPKNFQHQQVVHGRIHGNKSYHCGPLGNSGAFEVDPRSYPQNPQYRLSIQPSFLSTVYLLLNKHITKKRTEDAMAIDVYQGGEKVFSRVRSKNRDTLEKIGLYTSDDNCMVPLDLPPSKTKLDLTIVVCHKELREDLSYTLRIFSKTPLEFSKIVDDFPFFKEVSGSWDKTSAGGTLREPTFVNNPTYLLELAEKDIETELQFQLETDSKYYVHLIAAANEGRRIDWLDNKSLIAGSGDYQEQFCVLRKVKWSGRQPLTVVASTFKPGQLGNFKLKVLSSSCDFTFTPLPPEGHGLILQEIHDVWTTSTTGAENHHKPTFHITAKNSTTFMARLIASNAQVLPQINLTLYAHNKRTMIASTGPYVMSYSGVALHTFLDASRSNDFYLVASTWAVDTPSAFQINIFTDSPVSVVKK